ncbi:hypothetical protein HK097_004814, partial [Rhizophlyctis rosea]
LMRGEGRADEEYDVEAVLGLIRENQETGEQLGQLSALIEEHVAHSKVLKSENETLTTTLQKSEKKLKSREKDWSAKFTTLQKELEAVQEQQSTLDALLTAYESQYHGVAALSQVTEAPTRLHSEKDMDHPYPFATRFSHLHNLHTNTLHSLSLSQQKVAELQRTAEERLQKLETLEIAHQGKREECETSKREIEEFVRRCGELERRCREVEGRAQGLERRVGEVEGQKREVEGRLRKFVNGYRTLVFAGVSKSS